MAGDWIPYTKDLPRKPETLRIMRITGCTLAATVFGLLELWAWVDGQSEDGTLDGMTVRDLSEICPQNVRDVSADCTLFVRAVSEVGWLRADDGRITIPNFARWMGNSGKKRLTERLRKRDSRQKKKPVRDVSAMCPQDVRETSAERPRKTRSTGQDRTEENRREKKPPLPPPAFPQALDTDAFRAAFARWLDYRAQIKKPLKPVSVEALLLKLEKAGAAASIAAIATSMANSWQGLFPEKEAAPGLHGKAAADDFARFDWPDAAPKEGKP